MRCSSTLFSYSVPIVFFFNDTATTEIYTLSLHDALPILVLPLALPLVVGGRLNDWNCSVLGSKLSQRRDRKSTRLNSSHLGISYAVFCLKKKIDDLAHVEYHMNQVDPRRRLAV